MKKLVDLTMILSENTVVYQGDPQPSIKKVADYDAQGYYDSLVSFDVHNGTHMDAPKHFIKGGKSLDAIPIQRFFCRGVLVKVLGEKIIGKKHLEKTELRENDAVFFWTGHTKKAGAKDYFETNPVISAEAAEYLVSKKVSIVGLDSYSPDNPPFETHKILLGAGILIIENLVNLEKIEGKKFNLIALPAKILGTEAAPCRVIAEIIEQ